MGGSRKFLCFFLLILSLVSSCNSNGKWRCQLRLVVVHEDDDYDRSQKYTDIENQVAFLHNAFTDTDLTFDILPIDHISSKSLFKASFLDYLVFQQIANFRYLTRGEMTVFYVSNIDFKNILNGSEISGISSPPCLPVGFQQGVLIERHKPKDTLAHEIGHMWGLPHSWNFKFLYPDVKTEDIDDGHSDPCNIMNYSNHFYRINEEGNAYLRPSQIRTINSHILSPQRMLCIKPPKG